MRACYDHLTSEVAPGKPYYSPATALDLERSKNIIKDVLDEGLDSEIISKSEYDEMNPKDKVAGRFYCNFKVHKPHEHNKAPPVRPITSQSGSICEKIGAYVEYHIKHLATKHERYL